MTGARPADERATGRLRGVLAHAFPERIGFVWGALTNVVTTTLAYLLNPYAQLSHQMIIHLLGAVLISTRYGMAVATFTAITGSLAFDYFCIPPVGAFAMPNPADVVTFVGLLMIALLVCWLNQGLRYQRAVAKASEEHTQMLCELSLDLSRVGTAEELFVRAQRHLRELFGEGSELSLLARPPANEPGFVTRMLEDHGRVLGHIRVTERELEDRRADRGLLLAASADRIADALTRLELGDSARRAQVDAEVERNRSALLSSVSHDMKTPLASILTAGSSLLSALGERQGTTRELLETIVSESERLNTLITNLLAVTRLESGSAALHRELEALDDLVFAVLSRLSGRLLDRKVAVDVEDDLPLVSVDAALIDQLLSNLLENALRYTPAGSPIELRVSAEPEYVEIAVADRGPGVGSDERTQIFEKFYRGHAARRNDGGTGLGLTICRAVAFAHGGSIDVRDRAGGGSEFRVRLPLSPSAPFHPAPPERRTDA